MLGDRLLASKAYDDCSKNDTKLKELFQSTSFWNTTCTSDIDGAPGLSSGVFDGKHLSCVFPVVNPAAYPSNKRRIALIHQIFSNFLNMFGNW